MENNQALFTIGLQSGSIPMNAQKNHVQSQRQYKTANLNAHSRGNGMSSTTINMPGRNVNAIQMKASVNESGSASHAKSNANVNFHYLSGLGLNSTEKRVELDISKWQPMEKSDNAFNLPINRVSDYIPSTNGASSSSNWIGSKMNRNLGDFANIQVPSSRAGDISMNANRNDVSFQMSGSPTPQEKMTDNFIDNYFQAYPSRAKTSKASRSSRTVMMALPEGAEGEWGSVDRNYVIGGNWKSNGDWEFINSFPKDVLNKASFNSSKVEVVVAPTDLHLSTVRGQLADSNVKAMSQDVSQYGRGAYTGNVTADQLRESGIEWTLTGHSERRTLFKESDQDVALKTKIAVENGMNVMLCIGELLEERESGKTGEVNARQLQAVVDELTESQWGKVVIAYEPVWAIGTGKVATPQQAQDTHAEIRSWLADAVSPAVAGATRILYGGSVNGGNCADLITNPDIDGFLVGGASLKPEFADIIKAADDHKKA